MADTTTIDPSVSKLLVGIGGAFVSLRFVQGSPLERAAMVIGGAALSYFSAAPLANWAGIGDAEGLIGFLVGVFGMALVSKVYEGIQAFPAAQMAEDARKAINRRMGG